MAQNKPLFIPWLQQQIDSGQYTGVNWLNPERTLFTVPWKHALRQDSNSDDVRIFKAWASTNVNSEEKIPGDPSVWKRNFRSALRARGFTMHSDNKNDTANPHKIFKWPKAGQSGGESREGSQDYEGENYDPQYTADDKMFQDGAPGHNILEQCLSDLNINPEQEVVTVGEPPLFGASTEADLYSAAASAVPYLVDSSFSEAFYDVQLAEADLYSAAAPAVPCVVDGPISEVFHNPGFDIVGQISPAEGSEALDQISPQGGPCTGTLDQNPVQDTSTDSVPNFPTHYKVIVYYKGSRVLEQLVENDAGFRIVYRNDPSLMADTLPVVELPGTNSILDQTQASSTRDILDNLGGLEVREENGILFGHRWGDSRVFWGLCKHERGDQPRALSKNRPEAIYDFRDFCRRLMDFIQNSAAPSPSCTLYFFLGQNWPDPKNKPWEKKLIMIEVVFTSLERLKIMAIENGASSLQSDELQLSLEQMMEFC